MKYLFARSHRERPYGTSYLIFEKESDLEKHAIKYCANRFLTEWDDDYHPAPYSYNGFMAWKVDKNGSNPIKGFMDNIWEKTLKQYNKTE